MVMASCLPPPTARLRSRLQEETRGDRGGSGGGGGGADGSAGDGQELTGRRHLGRRLGEKRGLRVKLEETPPTASAADHDLASLIPHKEAELTEGSGRREEGLIDRNERKTMKRDALPRGGGDGLQNIN